MLQAIQIDTSEVTVWYKIGTIALKINNFSLARLGFEQVTIIMMVKLGLRF